ncbi:MAG: hypothetical protein WCK18_17430 [Prolixibacteraceae bacterium]
MGTNNQLESNGNHFQFRGITSFFALARKRIRYTLLFCILLSSEIVVAKTFYIAKDGRDDNSGLITNPFLTIQKGANLAQPGDTIFVSEGIYRERVSPPRGGTENAPIVYMAEPGKRVYIKGSDVYNSKLQKVANNIYACNLSIMHFTDDVYFDNANPFKVMVASTPFERDGAPEGVKDVVYNLGQVFVDGIGVQYHPDTQFVYFYIKEKLSERDNSN